MSRLEDNNRQVERERTERPVGGDNGSLQLLEEARRLTLTNNSDRAQLPTLPRLEIADASRDQAKPAPAAETPEERGARERALGKRLNLTDEESQRAQAIRDGKQVNPPLSADEQKKLEGYKSAHAGKDAKSYEEICSALYDKTNGKDGKPRDLSEQKVQHEKDEARREQATKDVEATEKTPPLKRGEGYYQALHRMHPDWSNEKLKEESAKLKKANGGRTELKVGEQFDTMTPDEKKAAIDKRVEELKRREEQISQTSAKNADGSETKRDEKPNGDYSEITSKDGQVISKKSRVTNADGTRTETVENKDGKEENQYDASGKLTKNRQTKPDGSYVESQYDQNGKVTCRHEQDKDGNYVETKLDPNGKVTSRHEQDKDGKFVESQFDQNGKVTCRRDQDKDGNYTETKFGDKGEKLSTKTHRKNAEGGYTDTFETKEGKDESQVNADGKLVRSRQTKPDGSFVESKFDNNGVLTSRHEEAKNGNYVETRYAAGGEQLSRKTHEVHAHGAYTDTTETLAGKTVLEAKADGSSHETGYDSKGGWLRERVTNADHSYREVKKNPDGTYSEINQDKQGKRTEQPISSARCWVIWGEMRVGL